MQLARTVVEEAIGEHMDGTPLESLAPKNKRAEGGKKGGPARARSLTPEQRRQSIRRFTRLTNAFSKKIENHAAAVAIWFMYYNFCRVHSTLRVTPAMESGISDHVWGIEEMCALLPQPISAARTAEKNLVIKALTCASS